MSGIVSAPPAQSDQAIIPSSPPEPSSSSAMPAHRSRSILLVSRGLDPIGTGRQIELVAHGFLATGWNVHLAVTTAGGAVGGRLARAGVTVHQLSTRPVVDAAAAVRLVRLARGLEWGPSDVILAWGRSQARLASIVKLLMPTVRLVSHLAMRPHGAITGLALGKADRVIASSPTVAAGCERAGVAAVKIDTIPPGADAAAAAGLSRADIATRLGLDPEKIWTLCVAPLVPEAKLERLLWAIDQLGVVHRRVEHVLVGAGPLRARVLRRARVQQLAERLHLFPHLDCLPDLLREVRLVWQSGEVAFGGALLDSMALGIPTVAVASDSARQLIVDDETGRIVPADPESEFPRRALGIIEDDALAARYGIAARARASAEFSADRMLAAVMAAAG
jgi:glycosyltransferase involved in cell wall biosynthesis